MRVILALLMIVALISPLYADAGGGDIRGVIRNIQDPINDVWDDAKNCLRVRISADSAIVVNQLTIDAAATGTAVVLSADETKCTKIIIKALPNNKSKVYIGPSAALVTTQQGFVMTASTDALEIPVDSTNDIYMDADTAGEGISWMAITR